MQTEFDQQRQTEDALTNVQAATPFALNPNQGTTYPSFWQNDDAWKEAAKSKSLVNPPSPKEINKQMWIGSFMTALMVGLTSKDPASAIAGGLWGAIAIHDHGNALRQRSEHVPQLLKEGYSAPAVQRWYNTGQEDGLNKERDDMLARDKFNEQNKDDDRNHEYRKERDEANDAYREENQRLTEYHRSSVRGMQRDRLNAMGRNKPLSFDEFNRLTPEQRRAYVEFKTGKPGGMFDPTAPDARLRAQMILGDATDGQLKAAGFSRRMQSSLREINDVRARINPGKVGEITKAIRNGTWAAAGMSDDEQRFGNALEDMIRAILRRESGAVIGKEERNDTAAQYFPLAGDGAEVQRRKLTTLQEYADNLRAEAGGAFEAFDFVAGGGNSDEPETTAAPIPDEAQQELADLEAQSNEILKRYGVKP